MIQTIFNSLEPIIEARLNEEKANLFEFLGDLDQKMQRVKNVETSTMALGRACHEAFKQAKEAAECLRDELGEASGTLVEATWN